MQSGTFLNIKLRFTKENDYKYIHEGGDLMINMKRNITIYIEIGATHD